MEDGSRYCFSLLHRANSSQITHLLTARLKDKHKLTVLRNDHDMLSRYSSSVDIRHSIWVSQADRTCFGGGGTTVAAIHERLQPDNRRGQWASHTPLFQDQSISRCVAECSSESMIDYGNKHVGSWIRGSQCKLLSKEEAIVCRCSENSSDCSEPMKEERGYSRLKNMPHYTVFLKFALKLRLHQIARPARGLFKDEWFNEELCVVSWTGSV